MEEKVEEITGYIQERCLWQFHSRAWDREANIAGVITQATNLLNGEPVERNTLAEKGFYADAKILVADLQNHFPWLQELDAADRKAILELVQERLIGITVTHSRNEELRVPNY